MNLIDLNFHASNEYANPQEVISRHWPSLGYAAFLKERVPVQVVKHISYKGGVVVDGIRFEFFKSRNRFWHIPFSTIRYIKTQRPCFVLVQGFVFPLQVICLKLALGKWGTICLQHHGERPFSGLKRRLQQLADRFVDAYSFASVDMARDWIEAGVISSSAKCYEIMGVSTDFVSVNKVQAKQQTGVSGSPAFVWVGRLNQNKDPLTVIEAFGKYLQVNPAAVLYMIYQENDLEDEVRALIDAKVLLSKNIKLVGKIPHEDLACWFSATDFYLSGSHREGSGYALIEAMACGCIPVVTDIPSFRKITDDGNCGLLYKAGVSDDLLSALLKVSQLDLEQESRKIENHFKAHLSFAAYAGQVQRVMDRFD